MKTKVWVFTALAMFAAVVATATELPKMDVVKVEANTALLAYHSVTKAPLTVSVTNLGGEVLFYKETEDCEEFEQLLNLSELGNGEFCVSVNYGTKSINRKINVKNQEIEVCEAINAYEPFVEMDGSKMSLSYLNTSLKPVYVNVYQDGNLINCVNLGRDLSVQAILDLSNLEPGEYEVAVKDSVKSHRFKASL
ncbi:MAG TPA: hypothetical protein VEP89_18260 [Draconibacterium sp.]|nr:hypothetical protein [Draconibacterium sp.]